MTIDNQGTETFTKNRLAAFSLGLSGEEKNQARIENEAELIKTVKRCVENLATINSSHHMINHNGICATKEQTCSIVIFNE
jgi:hypothetical protein